MRLLPVVVLALAWRSAGATGLCENTEPRFDPPELFDEATQSFAIPVSQPWCEETQDGGTFDELRGTVSFVELRDVHGKVLGMLSTATGADAEHLEKTVGRFEAIPFGKLHATLLARGYKPLKTALKCKVTTSWTEVADKGGWREAALQLDVMRAGKLLQRITLGMGSAARRGDQWVRFHVRGKQLAVFAIVPSCAGPPPGYFGPDDGGDCYHVDTPHPLLLDAPAIESCF